MGFVINHYYLKNKIDHSAFSGKIEQLTYDAKYYPHVVIDGESYHLGFGRDGELKVNDSLCKNAGSRLVKQYRNGILIEEFEW